MKRGTKVLFIPVYLSALFLAAWAAGFHVNVSASAPRGIYRISTAPVSPGDMASVCLPSDWSLLAMEREYIGAGSCPDGSQPLVKRVAALPGDAIDIDYEGIRINGVLQHKSGFQKFDSKGRKMWSELTPCYIPPGYVLLLSTMPTGFDSRYFGLVPLSSVRRVIPVLTF